MSFLRKQESIFYKMKEDMKLTKILFLVITIGISSCTTTKTVTVTNNLDIERSFETIEISKENLGLKNSDDLSLYVIEDQNGSESIVQREDTNGDGSKDIILFQPLVKPNSSTRYTVKKIPFAELPAREIICYSRFVPERTDDYAWENDKVAFRVYGPTAQKMVENSIEGGTLSSGVDCWLKRVEYPIINKWYKKHSEKTGTYHKDTGEGLDNYHVGTSRGCGGIAAKVDSSYYISKNYTNYKIITTGPIRTQFSLEYADWDAAGNQVKESRIITLDKGNQLSKFEISLANINQISVGLTLHNNDGLITKNKKNGWISYWEHLDDSELGTAVIIPSPNHIIRFDTYLSKTNETKNQYLEIKVTNNKIVYYAGFGWKKAKNIQTNKQWEKYLNNFSLRLKSPLQVHIN